MSHYLAERLTPPLIFIFFPIPPLCLCKIIMIVHCSGSLFLSISSKKQGCTCYGEQNYANQLLSLLFSSTSSTRAGQYSLWSQIRLKLFFFSTNFLNKKLKKWKIRMYLIFQNTSHHLKCTVTYNANIVPNDGSNIQIQDQLSFSVVSVHLRHK